MRQADAINRFHVIVGATFAVADSEMIKPLIIQMGLLKSTSPDLLGSVDS